MIEGLHGLTAFDGNAVAVQVLPDATFSEISEIIQRRGLIN